MKHYDVIIIGSGGGSKLTRPCANLGLKVAIIEKGKLGGTCLNHGCIPSKMLIHPADVATAVREAHRFNLYPQQQFPIAFSDLVQRVNQTIDHESASIAPLYHDHPNIDFYPHNAAFLSDRSLIVNGIEITADKIFLPIGARPLIPKIKGLENTPYMTYYEALRNQTLPKKLIIIGGGYIACELGYFYQAMGADVHFLVRSSLLRKEDKEIQTAFQTTFSKHFNVHFGVQPEEVTFQDNTFTLKSQEETIEGDALLVAAGVRPNTDHLGLEHTSIQLDKNGYILVDDHLQTAVPGIYAFGDAIGRYLYRHTANFEGEYLFRTLFEQPSNEPIDYPPIPHAIFTHPQVAGVGKTEQQLQEEGIDFVKGVTKYSNSAMGSALQDNVGFAKLLFDKSTRRLIGAHLMGEEASDMIHMAIAFMNKDATLDDMLRTIYIHPALPEVIRNAARDAKKEFSLSD